MGILNKIENVALDSVSPLLGAAKKIYDSTKTSPNVTPATTVKQPVIPATPTVTPPMTTVTPATQNGSTVSPFFQNLPDTSGTFKLDTSNIKSNYLTGDTTPSSVVSYRNDLQKNFEDYLAKQKPLQQQYADTTLFSPEEIDARTRLLNLNSGYRAGIQEIRNENIPLEFQQGKEAALTRDTALRTQAASDTLSNLEAIRKNNLDAISAAIGFNQKNYENSTGVLSTAQNYGLQAGQLGVSQQSANQNKYEFQQIIDPNTGFPTIKVFDKATCLS